MPDFRLNLPVAGKGKIPRSRSRGSGRCGPAQSWVEAPCDLPV